MLPTHVTRTIRVAAGLLLAAGCASGRAYDRGAGPFEPQALREERSRGGDLASMAHDRPGGAVATVSARATAGESAPAAPRPEAEGRLVVYTASFALLVSNPDDAARTFQKRIGALGGHMQAINGTTVTVRVPAARFNEVLEWLPEMGRVVSRQVVAEDVTRAVAELRLRIENAERSRERLLALLARAEKMEDVLKLEKEIARLTEQVELLRAELRGVGDRIAFSTVTVEFRAVAPEVRNVARREYSPFPWINREGAEHALRD